ISISAAGELDFTGSLNFTPGGNSGNAGVQFMSSNAGGITFAGGSTETINNGAPLSIQSNSVTFLGTGANITATGASAIAVTASQPGPLSIKAADTSSNFITTNGGTGISITEPGGSVIQISNLAASPAGTAVINLNGAPVTVSNSGAGGDV